MIHPSLTPFMHDNMTSIRHDTPFTHSIHAWGSRIMEGRVRSGWKLCSGLHHVSLLHLLDETLSCQETTKLMSQEHATVTVSSVSAVCHWRFDVRRFILCVCVCVCLSMLMKSKVCLRSISIYQHFLWGACTVPCVCSSQ